MLVGAMNPCPCGYAGDPNRACVCTPSQVSRYGKRISGPLLDRIDIFVEVPSVEYEKLAAPSGGESSAKVRERTELARATQSARFGDSGLLTNSEMGPNEVYQFCKMDEQATNLVRTAMTRMHLSARVYHRLLKLSRTVADLSGDEMINASHVSEALTYRPKALAVS